VRKQGVRTENLISGGFCLFLPPVHRNFSKLLFFGTALIVLGLPALCPSLLAGDQPQWGQAWSRNMISSERNLPSSFDPKTGQNIKWVAKLGTESHSTPIVADGRVYIGTNNGEPRNPKHPGDRGVLMCFDEKTGEFIWQLVAPKLAEDPYYDWPKTGLSSPATVAHKRVYIVSNRAEVLCLDPEGMANGNNGPFQDEANHHTPQPTNNTAEAVAPIPVDKTDADIIWTFDMRKEAGIWPHDGAHSSVLIDGDFLYVNTGTGVDNTHRKIRTPDAPSLIVLNKNTGRLLARDREGMAPNIFHCTWSSPSMARIDSKNIIFFAAGNGIIYAFEALTRFPASGEVVTLKKLWQFDPDPGAPKENVHRYTTNRREGPSNIYGMPVFYDRKLYVAGGGDLFWGKNEAWFKCIDFTTPGAPHRWPENVRTGDITATAQVWSYPLEKHTLSTPAVTGDIIFIADCGRLLHCVDRKSGKPIWTQEVRGEVWASPYLADQKIYLGTRSGDFYIMEASREKKLLAHVELGSPISATATAANGTLFVATMSHLYAVSQ
jgi:outer membrane protein assembly factor BamB